MKLPAPVLSLAIARMADALCNSMMIIVLPLHLADLARESLPCSVETSSSLVLSLFGFTLALVQPMAGRWADRTGAYRRFVEVGLVILAVATGAYVMGPGFKATLGLRAVQSLGMGLTIPATMALLTLFSETGSRGTVLGTYAAFRMSGFAVGPLLAGYLYDGWGPECVFATGAAAALCSAVLVRTTVPRAGRAPRQSVPFDAAVEPPTMLGFPVEEADEEPGPPDPRLRILGAAFFIMMVGLASLASLQNEMNRRLHQGATEFGLAFSALVVTRILVQIPLGALSDRFGRRGFVVAGLVMLGPVTAGMAFVTQTWQLVALRMLQGAAGAAVMAPGMALASDLAHKNALGQQLSIVTTSFSLGVATGLLFSGLAAAWIAFEAPFLIVGVLCPLAGIVVHLILAED